MTTTNLGLRDRKRVETRARIEDAAVSLVLRDGLDAATVDAISERADISPRTFFNYFDSKDSAILGVHQTQVSEELMGLHVEEYDGTGLVESVVVLLTGVMGGSLQSRATVHEDRLEVIRRHPEVLSGQMAQLSARSGMLSATIARLMERTPAFRTTPDHDRASYAELMLATCGSAVRAAVREWAAAGSVAPVDTIEARAVVLTRELVEKLA